MSKRRQALAPPARLGQPGLDRRRVGLVVVGGREEDRQPAVGDLGRQFHILGADGRQVDGQVGAAVQDALERLAQPGGVRPRRREPDSARPRRSAAPCVPRSCARWRRTRASCAAACHRLTPCQPSTTCGPERPRPSSMRPPESWSSVIAVMAVLAGVRAGICMMAVPRWMRSVCAPIQARGVTASEP